LGDSARISNKPPVKTIHLIPNAHVDPVWLWDSREGLTAGLATCRAVIALMEEFHDLTFVRGESLIYRQLEREDPATFKKIQQLVKAGRWDVVGGTFLQPDTNLPATETFCRQLLEGGTYLHARFGRRPQVVWAADSFGHSAGLCDLYAAAGMKYMAITRPGNPTGRPAWWWRGPAGGKLLVYQYPQGIYGTYQNERHDMIVRLEETLALLKTDPCAHHPLFFGLGNHGGGPTRRHIREILAWAKTHPEVRVEFSTFHRFFGELEKEAARLGPEVFPSYTGEINACFRGCYASAANLKTTYRRLENEVAATEAAGAALSAVLGTTPPSLKSEWETVLFNSFHDILPGSAIERALHEQLDSLAGARHTTRAARQHLLTTLSAAVDTTVAKVPDDHPEAVPFLVFNPLPRPVTTLVELETCLDHRPIPAWSGSHARTREMPLRVLDAKGTPLPWQGIAEEHRCFQSYAWRRRVLVPVTLPAWGWQVLQLGWVPGTTPPKPAPAAGFARSPRRGVIANDHWSLTARPGARGLSIAREGVKLFGTAGLQLATIEDPWGAWGAMDEAAAPESLDLKTVREFWTLTDAHVLESGPFRASLWVKFAAGRSTAEITFTLQAGRDAVDASVRLSWNERAARLKLLLPGGDRARYSILGGELARPAGSGEVPGGRWVEIDGPRGAWGFASDALYAFNAGAGRLEATLCRSARFACDETLGADDVPHIPAMDQGVHTLSFLISGATLPLAPAAECLERPVWVQQALSSPGARPRAGTLGGLEPSTLEMLAFKKAENGRGFILRIRNPGAKTAKATLKLGVEKFVLGPLKAGELATFRLTTNQGKPSAHSVSLLEV